MAVLLACAAASNAAKSSHTKPLHKAHSHTHSKSSHRSAVAKRNSPQSSSSKKTPIVGGGSSTNPNAVMHIGNAKIDCTILGVCTSTQGYYSGCENYNTASTGNSVGINGDSCTDTEVGGADSYSNVWTADGFYVCSANCGVDSKNYCQCAWTCQGIPQCGTIP